MVQVKWLDPDRRIGRDPRLDRPFDVLAADRVDNAEQGTLEHVALAQVEEAPGGALSLRPPYCLLFRPDWDRPL